MYSYCNDLFSGIPVFNDDQHVVWDPQSVAETLFFYIKKLKINNVSISGLS